MRRIYRQPLTSRTQTCIRQRQARVDAGNSVQQAWASARRTKALQSVFDILVKMAGTRDRCYFCSDSRGTDIDHFRPKSRYPEHTFAWPNLLLVCSGCNRKKADQFPLDPDGQPLLIDPTSENPWDDLFFEPATGQIVARWDLLSDVQNPKGVTTTDDRILPLNIEAVTEGRRRVTRHLARAVRTYLLERANPADREQAFTILRRALIDHDEYGLSHWFFIHDGQHAEPFKTLRENHFVVWERLQASFTDQPSFYHDLTIDQDHLKP